METKISNKTRKNVKPINTAIITPILSFFAGIIIVSSSLWLASTKEDVTITQTMLVGDKNMVENYSISFYTTDYLSNHWQIETPLHDASHSEISYHFRESPWESTSSISHDFRLVVTPNMVTSTLGLLDFDTISEDSWNQSNLIPLHLLADVASRTPLNETHSETILMADCFDFLPISHDINTISGNWMYGSYQEELLSHFQFPIPPQMQLELSVTKNSEGIIGYSTADTGDFRAYLHQSHILTEEGVFYASQLIVEQKKETQITDNVGENIWEYEIISRDDTQIIQIVWNDSVTKKGYPQTTITDISTIATVDSSNTLIDMVDLGENVGILMFDGHNYAFAIHKKQDFTLLQSVPLSHEGRYIEEKGEVFLIFSGSMNEISVIEKENGHYFVGLSCKKENIFENEESYYFSNAEHFYENGLLFVVSEQREHHTFIQNIGDIFVECYHENGLIFASLYEIHQKIGVNYYTYSDIITLYKEKELISH